MHQGYSTGPLCSTATPARARLTCWMVNSEQKGCLDDKRLGQMIKATAYLNPKWTSFKNEKLLRANRLKWGLGNGNPLQHSSRRIPWTGTPSRLQSIGSQRLTPNRGDLAHTMLKWSCQAVRLLAITCFNNHPVKLSEKMNHFLPVQTTPHAHTRGLHCSKSHWGQGHSRPQGRPQGSEEEQAITSTSRENKLPLFRFVFIVFTNMWSGKWK